MSKGIGRNFSRSFALMDKASMGILLLLTLFLPTLPISFYSSNECPVVISNSRLRVSIDTKSGHFSVYDVFGEVLWKTDDARPFIEIIRQGYSGDLIRSTTLSFDNPCLQFVYTESSEDGRTKSVTLTTGGSSEALAGGNLKLYYILNIEEPQLTLKVEVSTEGGPKLLNIQTGLTIEADEEGYLVIPNRMGAILPSRGPNLRASYDLYHNSGLGMAFYGAVKKGSAYLVTLDNLYHEVEVRRAGNKTSISTIFQGRSISSTITFIPNGTYVDIAKQYKKVAIERGLYNPACRLTEKHIPPWPS